jgi:hypothetical protein
MASQLTPEGPVYTVMAALPLEGKDSSQLIAHRNVQDQ